MTRILIYEPNLKLAQKLESYLTEEGYQVISHHNAASTKEDVGGAEKILAIIDARMKWSECRPLLDTLAGNAIPVLFITCDSHMADHLKALYPLQCDVLCYPFSMHRLGEKLRSLNGVAEKQVKICMNHQEKTVTLDGRCVSLTAQEYALLSALMETPDEPVSREHLLRTAWGYQSMGETRTVDVHVQRLRKKLGVERIETVYKCGYRLRMA